jgi:hypothetical protein
MEYLQKQVEGLRGRVKPEDSGVIRCSSSFYPVKGLKPKSFLTGYQHDNGG